MNIQAVNALTSARACQPIKPVSFEKAKEKPSFTKEVLNNDKFTPSQPDSLEQKYDVACLLAGYYKTQYESLLQKGGCTV